MTENKFIKQFCTLFYTSRDSAQPIASDFADSVIDYFKNEQVYYLSTTISNIKPFVKTLVQFDKTYKYCELNLDDFLSYFSYDKDAVRINLKALVSQLNDQPYKIVLIINGIHKLFATGYDPDTDLDTWRDYPNVRLLYADTEDNYERYLGVPMTSELLVEDRNIVMNNLTELAHYCKAYNRMKDPERCIKNIDKLSTFIDHNNKIQISRKLFTGAYLASKKLRKPIDDITFNELIEML